MVTERTYIVPLRRYWLIVPKYKRAKKAVSALRNFIIKHMKSEDILIGKKLNQAVWARGMKNPPHKIKITVVKDNDGLVKAELFGHKYIEVKKIAKEEKETGLAGKLKSALKKPEEEEDSNEEATEHKEPKEAKPVSSKPVSSKPAPKKDTKPADKKPAEKPAKK